MKLVLLQYLVCPVCQSELECKAVSHDGDEITEGQLACLNCGRVYPIVRAIPRMLPDAITAQSAQTAEAFGWEWRRFPTLHSLDDYRAQFLDWIHPVEPEFFGDKLVLDAGCGMGRFALVASKFGARHVIALDLSDAVEAARDNAVGFPNVHVV